MECTGNHVIEDEIFLLAVSNLKLRGNKILREYLKVMVV